MPDWSLRGELLEDELIAFVRFSRELRNAVRDGTPPPVWPSNAHPGSIRSALLDCRFGSMRRLRKRIAHLDTCAITSRGGLSREVDRVAESLELQARLSLRDTGGYEDYLLRSGLVSEAHRACSVMLRRVREFRQDYGEALYRGQQLNSGAVDVRTMSYSRECGYREVMASFEVVERRMSHYELKTKGLSAKLTRYVRWMGTCLQLVGWFIGCGDLRGKPERSDSSLCGRFPNIYVLPVNAQLRSDRVLRQSKWHELTARLREFRMKTLRFLWTRRYRELSALTYRLISDLQDIEHQEQSSLASHRFILGFIAVLSLRSAAGMDQGMKVPGGRISIIVLLGLTYLVRWLDEGAQVFHQMGIGILENDLPRFDVSL